jgi:hypothetical protein
LLAINANRPAWWPMRFQFESLRSYVP